MTPKAKTSLFYNDTYISLSYNSGAIYDLVPDIKYLIHDGILLFYSSFSTFKSIGVA
jgi:hypothetical protein